MTRAQRKKLAKAARELASLYAEDQGPELTPGTWCGCVAGQLFKRARVSSEPTDITEWRMPAAILDLDSLDGILTDATNAHCIREAWDMPPLPGAVVFALLWAADELESQR